MQLLLQIDTPDYDGWKSAWDSGAEDRANSGLTQLQLWRAVDHSAAVALLEVHNKARAEEWLAKETAFGGATTATFLRTA
ncbi:hypothetical protein [Falsirhodobacter deserti]|uniref:hypothetical protein n=1 Tax=Falsirhodobacter deserti TaxID=1365611 RepID=UPI000FE3F80B|nr:hypothetical protein [Falsirhodobacter deserti]